MARSLLKTVMSLLTNFFSKCHMINNTAKPEIQNIPPESTRDVDLTMSQVQRATTVATSDSTGTDSSANHTQLIAESAYFAAEKRNFCGGDPIEDWLIAERELINSTTR